MKMLGGEASLKSADARHHRARHSERSLAFNLLEKLHDGCFGWYSKFSDTAWRYWPLKREKRAMAISWTFLHLDKLTEIGESGLNLRIDMAKVCSFYRMLNEIVNKCCVGRQTRVATDGKFIVTVFEGGC